VPHLLATDFPLQTQWLMQDGARPHTANVALGFLYDTFDSQPPNSSDLNPWDYFLWGFLKEKIFPKQLQRIMELRALIIQTCNETTDNMSRRVINNITVCVEVVRHNGGHLEH
jgi:hypothetical protein